ncbi:MAG: HD domain-containing protein [Planctomycetota bacterium]|nr:HD domain-containing protein [Planctomycetota bacterium]
MTILLWQKAASFAARAHRHQFRRDGVTPYAAHPTRVAMIVASEFGVTDEIILAAAYLHDVIEDCDVDYDDVHVQFGIEVADMVACLSKDTRMIEPDREKAYHEQLAHGSWQVRLIKLADVYDNLMDAEGEASKKKLLNTVQKALELAAGEPGVSELEKASKIVSDQAALVEESLKSFGS